MPNATKALRRRWVRRHPTSAAGLRGNGAGAAGDEPSFPSPAMGQLIDMAEWRLLPPVDPTADGAA